MVNTLVRSMRARRTMICLSALDFINTSDAGTGLWNINRGFNWDNAILILNNGEAPARLVISASGEQDMATSVIPTIILKAGLEIGKLA